MRPKELLPPTHDHADHARAGNGHILTTSQIADYSKPLSIDAVLIYAQHGHGKRSSYYSDFTFAVWSDAGEDAQLLPVGKAYSGFSDEEMKQLDSFVRENTIQRFGPVRSVRADPQHVLVVEPAFEGLNRSIRHKSGLALRFPRISTLRWNKPPAEADILQNLMQLLPVSPPAS